MTVRKIAYVAFAAVLGAAGVGNAGFAWANPETGVQHRTWSWQGPFGHYDKRQLQRGFQVYAEVCSTCHGLNQLYYRNLLEIGLSEATVKAYAAGFQVQAGFDDLGEPKMRPAALFDRMHNPFANEQLARLGNNGALPPDLSLIAKARPGGPDYVSSLLLSYAEPPLDFNLTPGMNYNAVFAGGQIAMPPPLSDDRIAFADGTPAALENLVVDVTAFLNWAAEPELEARKGLGIKVLLFLIVMTAFFYALKRKIWRGIEH